VDAVACGKCIADFVADAIVGLWVTSEIEEKCGKSSSGCVGAWTRC
jgi:hypothetical protein